MDSRPRKPWHLVKDWNQSHDKIMAIVGCTKAAVINYRKKHGKGPAPRKPGTGRKLRKGKLRRNWALVKDWSLPLRDIAEIVSCSTTAVRHHLKKSRFMPTDIKQVVEDLIFHTNGRPTAEQIVQCFQNVLKDAREETLSTLRSGGHPEAASFLKRLLDVAGDESGQTHLF